MAEYEAKTDTESFRKAKEQLQENMKKMSDTIQKDQEVPMTSISLATELIEGVVRRKLGHCVHKPQNCLSVLLKLRRK